MFEVFLWLFSILAILYSLIGDFIISVCHDDEKYLFYLDRGFFICFFVIIFVSLFF